MKHCTKVKCDLCDKEFQNIKSMTNHRRWHKLPQYTQFQKGFIQSRKNLEFTEEYREKLSQTKLGILNPQWKGDNAGYGALHDWIKRYKPKPEKCERCKISEPFDIANISGKYFRDLNDFEWLCRKCHMTKDGRLEIFARGGRYKKMC